MLAQETLLKRVFAVAMILLLGVAALLTPRHVESGRAARERAVVNTRLGAALHAAETARSRAEEADRVKTEMLGIAAHDLRNPLSSIIGFADLIRTERESIDDARRHAGVIIAAAERTLKLVSDLLESAVLDAGQIKLQKGGPAIWRRCSPTPLPASRRGHRASSSRSTSARRAAPSCSRTSARLDQIFDNLLSNAVKFSPPKGLIEAWIDVDGERVRVAIRDYGPGLSSEDRKHLFRRFQRLSARPTGGESSTGLGLAIVKDLVELHGGSVRAESEGVGRGATFFVDLPRLQNPPLRLTAAANENQASPNQRAS